MKQLHLRNLTAFPAAAIIALSAHAQSNQPPAKITAWGQHYGGNIVYKYEVHNLGQGFIKRFLTGHYLDSANGAAELSTEPVANGSTFWLSSQEASTPEGWGAKIVYPEESSTFFIEWIEASYHRKLWPKAPEDGPTPRTSNNGIPPGATWSNFSITIPSIDPAYAGGHATIDYNSHLVNIPITKGDQTPPVISLIVNRINQNESHGSWAIFDIQASVEDNFDPSPTLVMKPISSNQHLQKGDVVMSRHSNAWSIKLRNYPDRVYQLKYTSMDASGNAAAKTYEYVVK